MPLDHSKATATITFDGLLVFCVNKSKQVELAFLSCRKHRLKLSIKVVLPTGAELPMSHSLNLQENISIKAVNPVPHKDVLYKNGEFCRKEGRGDQEDIRWVFDMEGPEFHNIRLKDVIASPGSSKSKLQPKLLITDCILYTYTPVLPEQFAREQINMRRPPAPTFLGKAADVIAADIICEKSGNSGIVIGNIGKDEPGLKLPTVDGIRYKIEFRNKCGISRYKKAHSDFTLYYDVLKDPRGHKYDLKRVVPASDPAATGAPFPDLPMFAPDDRPQKCGGVGRSLTKSIFDSDSESGK